MIGLELTEVLAWALIVGGAAFALLARQGVPTAAIGAGLAAMAVKSALLPIS